MGFSTIAWDEDLIEIDVPAQAAPHPYPSTSACLVNAAPEAGAQRQVRLFALGECVLGRWEQYDPEADVLLAHFGDDGQDRGGLTRRLSGRHAVIRRGSRGFEIEDVSRYGVLLDGVWPGKNKPVPLRLGMRIELSASIKGIVVLSVTALLPHGVILHRIDQGEFAECFYFLEPGRHPGFPLPAFPREPRAAVMPLLFHQNGGFWHLDPVTGVETALSAGDAARPPQPVPAPHPLRQRSVSGMLDHPQQRRPVAERARAGHAHGVQLPASIVTAGASHAIDRRHCRRLPRRAAGRAPPHRRNGAQGHPRQSRRRLQRDDAIRHDRLRGAAQRVPGRLPLRSETAAAVCRHRVAKELRVGVPDGIVCRLHRRRRHGGEEQWFREAWAASGKKKLDMGKVCVRFKKLDDVALDVIGEAIRRMPAQRYIERYEAVLAATVERRPQESRVMPSIPSAA